MQGEKLDENIVEKILREGVHIGYWWGSQKEGDH
jgi:hypothetical protein